MKGATMVDVGAKPVVARAAEAEGRLRLRPETLRAIKAGNLAKGDALEIGRIAGILAAKHTPSILPLCHPLPLDSIEITFTLEKAALRVNTRVQAHAKTGVEMEALVAASVALLAVWDVVKPHEKDAKGQYPTARLEDVHVVRKVKG